MKSTPRAVLAGLVACAVLMVVLHAVGLVDLGALLPTGAAKRLVFGLLLRPPPLPDADSLPDHGRVDGDWTLVSLAGEPVRFSDFEGKPVFVNVWATWCVPCVMEMPVIERLYRSLEGSEIQFVVVSQEDVEILRAFVEETPLDLPLFAAEDLPEVFRGNGVPLTFIVDPDGTVVFKHQGAARWDDDSCREFLRGRSG